ncbi:hypothetical protein B0H14DRAFT_2600956 [Mycena olivaceomarginata]|nr:hypothetical protein B0H14DRAFT_2600956 [Mycena olivaceomarginata]
MSVSHIILLCLTHLFRFKLRLVPIPLESAAAASIKCLGKHADLIFNLSKLIAVFAGSPVAVYTSLDQVNAYISIICTVFTTVWSLTISFKEAIAQGDTIASLKSVVFRMETMDAPPEPHLDDSLGTVKLGNWEENDGNGKR